MKKEFPLAVSGRLKTAYYEMTWMNLSATLYDFYEGYREKRLNPGPDSIFLAKSCLDMMQILTSDGETDEAAVPDKIEELKELRKTITERVEQMTYYTDRLAVYEYLLNRAEYGFKTELPETDDEEEARKILRFIFSTEDNAAVNMRIRDMVSQLPVRMTKGHFYDLVRSGLGIYEGTDEASLQGFLYMVLSAAGIRKEKVSVPENEDYEALIDYLAGFDYSILSEADFGEIGTRLGQVTEELSGESEFLLALAETVNYQLALLLLSEEDRKSSESRHQLLPVVREVTEAFARALSENEEPEISEETVSRFTYLEGRLEKLSEAVLRDEGKLDEYLAENASPAEEVRTLGMVKRLIGTSSFASFENPDMTPVTAERILEAGKALTEALDRVISGRDRRFVRAVMAQVLKELPVFFNSHTEVMNYCLQSLKGCRDNAEKRAALDLLWQMFE